MAEYGLRSAHVSCLYYLHASESLTATDLCERCEEDKATISRALDYLEANGFITCETKHTKRYKSPLILTQKGKDASAKIAEKIDTVLNEMSNGLSEDERAEFYRCLNIISESLERCTVGVIPTNTRPLGRN